MAKRNNREEPGPDDVLLRDWSAFLPVSHEASLKRISDEDERLSLPEFGYE